MEKENTPILVANTEWPLPENLKKDIQTKRMIIGLFNIIKPNILKNEEQVGWAECIGYLMPATSKAALKKDVSEIYLYCVRKYLEGKKMEIPDIGLPEKLSDYQNQQLIEFKRWIFLNRGGREKNPILNILEKVFLKNK